MKLLKVISKTVITLALLVCLSACKEEPELQKVLCVDADTSIKNDIPKEGVSWSLSINDLKHITPLIKEESARNIYVMNSITTCEMEFNDIEIDNKNCKVTLNAGAYGYIECNDGSKRSFGCYQKECDRYFPFPFIDEETTDSEPAFTKLPDTFDKDIYTNNYKNYLNKMGSQSVKGKIAVKVYFINPNLDDSSYVIRHVDKDSPLKNTIQEYLNGLTPEEKKLGFESSNFGNDSFIVKIENHIAKIHFTASDLTKDLRSPQQVIDFTSSIDRTAEQFDTVDDAEICVNNTYNYHMSFLANEEPVDCPF